MILPRVLMMPSKDTLSLHLKSFQNNIFAGPIFNLERQDATGDNNTLYWFVLVGFWDSFRSLSFSFLARKAHHYS